jgi:hypothetical protein
MANIPNPGLKTHRKKTPAAGQRTPATGGRNTPLDELKPDPSNPRTHGRVQIRAIARSINRFQAFCGNVSVK